MKHIYVTANLLAFIKAALLIAACMTLRTTVLAQLCRCRIWDVVWMYRGMCMGVDCQTFGLRPTRFHVAVEAPTCSLDVRQSSDQYAHLMLEDLPPAGSSRKTSCHRLLAPRWRGFHRSLTAVCLHAYLLGCTKRVFATVLAPHKCTTMSQQTSGKGEQ